MNYRAMMCPECGGVLQVGLMGPGCTDANDPGVWCSSPRCRWSEVLPIASGKFRTYFNGVL